MNNIKVLIPVQLASTRVKLKNIRPFYNEKSLFDIKAEQILTSGIEPENVYVSSESIEVNKLCQKYRFNFIKRPIELTGNSIRQPDLIHHFLTNIPNDNDDILWVQVTNPLFDKFGAIIESWDSVKEKGFDSIVAVKTIRHHLLTEKGIPLNFNFGYWHMVSQNLPKIYEILWSAFLLKRSTIEMAKYHIGIKPFYMPFDDIYTVDIDTESDFELASLIYQHVKGKNK